MPTAPFAELQDVVTTLPVVADDGDVVPAGTAGTVIHAHPGHSAYVVEFSAPCHALATCTTGQLAARRRA